MGRRKRKQKGGSGGGGDSNQGVGASTIPLKRFVTQERRDYRHYRSLTSKTKNKFNPGNFAPQYDGRAVESGIIVPYIQTINDSRGFPMKDRGARVTASGKVIGSPIRKKHKPDGIEHNVHSGHRWGVRKK